MLDVIVVGAGLRYVLYIKVSNLEGIRDQSIQFSLDRNADLTRLNKVTMEQYVKNRGTTLKTVEMVNL
ncbi:putative flavin-containing amine oxidase protein [Neofusicoccum parvum UCRNP2]|uniref:Putative flavin-containing amine oxidase protein n=1 Tax=Botryosphaeria parva (strain UCR-NP2) TaxID=1287680 RepID=R1EKJ0_BOTPV|nr:putative flavin-containing amine oxidase protein [Neofusicoccum parvum UCRNP2]